MTSIKDIWVSYMNGNISWAVGEYIKAEYTVANIQELDREIMDTDIMYFLNHVIRKLQKDNNKTL